MSNAFVVVGNGYSSLNQNRVQNHTGKGGWLLPWPSYHAGCKSLSLRKRMEVKEKMHGSIVSPTPIQKCLGEYIKVAGSDEPVTHLGNVRVDPMFLDYVRTQMRHEDVNGEVIGETINMMAEFDEWGKQLRRVC